VPRVCSLQGADQGASNGGGKCRADKINAPNGPLRGIIDALRVRCAEGRIEGGEPEKKKSRTDGTSGGVIQRRLMMITLVVVVIGKENWATGEIRTKKNVSFL
jgi:hypothetical protein